MRLVDAVAWFGPAALVLCAFGAASPTAASAAAILAVGTTVTLGVGHGALDHELPHQLGRAARSATMRIAAVYAGIMGLGFAAFLAAPLPMLGVFLVISVFHFGTADVAFSERYAGVRCRYPRLRTIALGAFPIAVPVLAQTQAVLALIPHAHILRVLQSNEATTIRLALLGCAALATLGPTVARVRRPGAPVWYRYELALSFAAFVWAPPGVAFFAYFGAWHAPRHLLRLAAAYGVDPYARLDIGSARHLAGFVRRALPMSATALGLAAVVCALLAPTMPLTMVATALGFAVTVPHTFAVRFFNHSARDAKVAAVTLARG